MNDTQKNDIISAEDLEKALDASMNNEPKNEPTSDDNAATAQVEKTGEEVVASTPQEPAKFEVNDALLERAIKAGLTASAAKSFSSAESAEEILKALESKAAPTGTTEVKGDDSPSDDLLKEIEAHADDYDPELVKALRGFSAQNKELLKKVGELTSAKATEQAQSFFDKQVGELGEGVAKHLDAASKSKLMAKYEALKSAYGDTPEAQTEAFKDAAKLAIGDILAKAETESKTAKVDARKNLRLAQPGGITGKPSKAVSADDEVASLIAQKYNLK